MAGSRSAQSRAREESLRDKIKRRTREAEAAAYEHIKQAIRAGIDLQLKTPSEVLAYGAKRLHEEEARAAEAASNAIRVTKRQASDALNRLGRDQGIRTVAVDIARKAGNAAGVARGGVHAVEGLVDGGAFVNRLFNPLDVLTSPPGESAVQQLNRGSAKVGRAAVGYVRRAVDDPGQVVRDVNEKAQQWRRELDPSATPMAPTFADELRRNFDIGQNQGEVAFNLGSLVVGGPAAKVVGRFGGFSKAVTAEKYLAQGATPKVAAYLAEPYPSSGMGHHFIPRRYKLPEFLGGENLPRSYSDGPFNRLAPPDISRGDMYARHFRVDPHFHGARLPAAVGGGSWRGEALGLEKYGPAGRIWFGSPGPLKARVGGFGLAGGAAMNGLQDEEAYR